MSQVTLIAGAVWGFVGAIVMVVVMQAIGSEGPPPFAVFWAKYVGDGDPGEAMPESLVLHAVYAVVAGAIYAPVFTAVGSSLGLAPTSIVGGIVWGVVWAIVLFAVAAVFWVNIVLDMDPDRPQVMSMAAAHLGYGLTLGILGALVPHLA